MDEISLKIARFLAIKARLRSRTTYQEVAANIGWNHPTGRGLGKSLKELLYHCKESKLPPITTILVPKGSTLPAAEAISYIKSALGEIRIEDAQDEVFLFDWSSVRHFNEPIAKPILDGKNLWLTSFWGFEPSTWGYVGFATEAKRRYFMHRSPNGAFVAIYITKSRGAQSMRGKVVGIFELSNKVGLARDFMTGDRWVMKENDPETKGKWMFGIQAIRAWRVAEENWTAVERVFPQTYRATKAEFIGSQGVLAKQEDLDNLLALTVYEVPVYGQTTQIQSALQPFGNILYPSRAVLPATSPYWVGETDGPKYLYIMNLVGNLPAYLGISEGELDDRLIVKVGFSKSPLSRRNQLQSAYPEGKYKWQILYPDPIPNDVPYSNATVAIAGEDAMKARLQTEGGLSLGGEFFLADEGLIYRAWHAGKYVAELKEKSVTNESQS